MLNFPGFFPAKLPGFTRSSRDLSQATRFSCSTPKGALELTELLTDNSNGSHRLDESAREVLTEVGNILLNACLGVFGNVLHVQVGFSVPRLRLDNVDQLVQWLNSGGDELRYALVIFTKFQVRYSQVNGYLVLVLNMAAFDRLVNEIDHWVEEDGRA
jgi:chemotaxis protein CheC